MAQKTNGKKNGPCDKVKLGRYIATIWRNETKHGARFNATLERVYLEGKEWKYSDSFGRDDLLAISKLADMAHSRIFELEAAENDAESNEED